MNTDTNRFSGAIGDEYALFNLAVPHHEELQETVRAAILEYIRPRKLEYEFRVIEIGCGTGITTRKILETDSRIKIIAIDSDPAMIKKAKEELSSFGDRVTFCEQTAYQALSSMRRWNWIDIIASAYTLHNLDEIEQRLVFSEIRNRLKRGGLFVNADKYANDDPEAHARELAEQIERFKIFDDHGRPDLRTEWTRHYQEDDAIHVPEWKAKLFLEIGGFTDVRTIFRKGMEATILGTLR